MLCSDVSPYGQEYATTLNGSSVPMEPALSLHCDVIITTTARTFLMNRTVSVRLYQFFSLYIYYYYYSYYYYYTYVSLFRCDLLIIFI